MTKCLRLAVSASLVALTACGSDIDKLVIGEGPASQYQGEVLSAVTVQAFDKDGKLVTDAHDTVTVTVSEGEIGGTTRVALNGGVATFADLHVDTAVSGATVTVKADGKSVTSDPFDVNGVTLALSVPPVGLVSGDLFVPTAIFQDAQAGTTIPIVREVTLSATGDTLAGVATRSSVNGIATFADVFVASGGTGVTLTATAPASDAATVGPFDVTQLVLVFSGVGAVGAPDTLGPYGVRLTDGAGSILTNTQRTVTLAGTPAVGGATSVPTANGVAMFSDLFVVASGSVSMTASAAGAAPITATVQLSFSGGELELANKSTVTNDTSATAEPVSPGVPVFGSLQTAGDVDYYRFHALAGQRLEVASYGVRLDQADFSGGTEIALWATDGTTRMQLVNATVLEWSQIDHGLQEVLVPADGDYFVSIAVEGGGAGGDYAIEVWLRDAGMPLQRELEPVGTMGMNDSRANAEQLVPGELYGFFNGGAAGDPDVYHVAIEAPARVRAQITSHRNGWYASQTDRYDPQLALQNGAGVELWNNDDTKFYDAGMDFLVTVSGDYFLLIDRCCDAGAAPYFLNYTVEPVTLKTATEVSYGDIVKGASAGSEEHLFHFTATQGDAVRVASLASTLSASLASTALLKADGTTLVIQHASSGDYRATQAIIPATATYYIRVTSSIAGDWAFSLERVADAPWEVEPNSAAISAGAPAEANAIANAGRVAGAIDAAGDRDNFSFSAHGGQLVSIDLFGGPGGNDAAYNFSNYGTSLAPSLAIHDASGTTLASTTTRLTAPYAESLNRPLAMLSIAFRAPADAMYYVVVSDRLGSGGDDHSYWLQLHRNQ